MRPAIALIALSLSKATHAHAAAAECIAAHADGQVLRKSGKLEAARVRFEACENPGCPALVRKDCTSFMAELESAQPTLLISAKSGAGTELANVLVSIDASTPRTLGGALPIDPGEHQVDVTLSDGRRQSRIVTVREGERAQLMVSFPLPDGGAAEGASAIHVPVASYVLGGVGVAALGSFAYFGLRGHSKQNSLDECAKTHTCPQGEVHEMRRLYLAADISLGVSLVSLGLGAYLLFTRSHDEPAPSTAQRGVQFGLTASPSAYALTASGHF